LPRKSEATRWNRNRLRLLGNVLRRDLDDSVQKCAVYEVDGEKPSGIGEPLERHL